MYRYFSEGLVKETKMNSEGKGEEKRKLDKIKEREI